jgi:hypothetical protein
MRVRAPKLATAEGSLPGCMLHGAVTLQDLHFHGSDVRQDAGTAQ